MTYNDFIILEINADFDDVRRRRSSTLHIGPISAPMSVNEILVSRPPRAQVADYIRLQTIQDAKDAAEASRDPRRLVARAMPVSIIRPLDAVEAGVSAGTDPIFDAKAVEKSWGVAEVLGLRPRVLSGKGVKLAILDTGIDPAHAAFEEIRHSIEASRRNFTSGNDGDVDGHGTHCAGTIFGRDVEDIRIGVAPGVTDVLIGKVIGDDGVGSTSAILEALQWAHSQKANVISMSLGFDFPEMQKGLMEQGHPPELATSIALKAYRDNLRQFETVANLLMQETDDHTGTVLVAAAGNESRRDQNPDFLIDVSIPAAAAVDMISVAAAAQRSDKKLDVAPFSNINPRVAAPGVGVVSARRGGGLVAMNGTSMACPHAAGVAALWWEWIASRNGGRALASDVRAQVRATARDERFQEKWTITDRGSGCVTGPQLSA